MQYYEKGAELFGEEFDRKFYYGDVKKDFNFLYFAHSDHHETMRKLLAEAPSRFAMYDFAAAFCAQMQYRGLLDFDSFWPKCLDFFDKALLGRHYKRMTLDEVVERAPADGNIIFLILGCQTHVVRNSRVAAAYKLVRALKRPNISVIFSGAHPSTPDEDGPRSERYPIEPDEAGAMRTYFSSLIQEDSEFPDHFKPTKYVREDKATRTSENVKHFFKEAKLDTSKKNYLYISSSSFHIARAADEIEDVLQKEAFPLERITLVSAEHYSKDYKTIGHQIYVKQMAFELFRALFEAEQDYLPGLFQRETSMRV